MNTIAAASTGGGTSRSFWRLLALLLLGGVCVAFGEGRWPVPLAALVAPVLLLRFVRSAPVWLGIVGFTIVHAAAWDVAYTGMAKMPMFARWSLFVGLSLVLAFVYLADRRVSTRSARFRTTLVFPCGWVAFEYLNGRFSPSGSWSSVAYTFTDHNALVQVASLVGWTGITFLVGWVASVVNWAWRHLETETRAAQYWGPGCAACVATLAGVLVFGSVRLWSAPAPETVRVASLVGPSTFFEGDEFRRDVWAYTRGIEIPEEQRAAARQHIQRTMERHMTMLQRELAAGAKIVSFPEANPSITKAEEAAFVTAAGRLASEYGAYVGLGLFVFRPEAGLPAENKFVLLGPDGTPVWDYLKARLVPGSKHVVGDGTLPIAATSLGTLSCAICFDMDFPVLLQQAGRGGADILLAPSNDWTEVRAMHARMATMRAVEQGFNMVRPTKDGFALVTDALGRTIAWQDTDRPGEHVLIADVPTSRVRTLYTVIGDAFSWTCIAAFLVLLGAASTSTRKVAQPPRP